MMKRGMRRALRSVGWWLGLSLLVSLGLGGLLAGAPAQAERIALGVTPQGLSPAAWQQITQQVQQHRYQVAAVMDGYRAANPGQQWQTTFDGAGFLVTPQRGDWTWGLALRSYGLEGAETPVAARATLTAQASRIEAAWDARLTEWWLNDARGLEHGFTLRTRPPGQGEALTLTLAVQGGLTPQVQTDGLGVTFTDAWGAAVVQYAGLRVTDAQGQEVPARLRVASDALQLRVQERAARYPLTIDPLAQQAYLKASNPDANDYFGYAVAMDGDTLVVGAYQEDSSAAEINGNEGDNSAESAGAAYVFVRSGTDWSQQAYLKASNSEAGDNFGYAVAVNGDTVVVGASGEDSSATQVNGNQDDNSAESAGAAYVFVRSGTAWTQQAYLKASNSEAGDYFGTAVAVDVDTVVVGADGEASSAMGVNGNQDDNSCSWAGAAYVFVRSGTVWTQQAYLKASNTGEYDEFGGAVAVNGDTVVVGADQEDSSAGAAYVFVRSGTVWTQQSYLKASNTEAGDNFGTAVAVSGNTVVVGAYQEDSSAMGVNGIQTDNSATNAGAAYVFVRSGTVWTQQAYLKASNTGTNDYFGYAVAVDGDTVVVGAYQEDSSATGFNGNENDNSVNEAGAAYVFVRSGADWSQQTYLKASNTGTNDYFGRAVAVDGDTVMVGAWAEDSSATGFNGNQTDNSASDAGAAYVFAPALAPTVSSPTYADVTATLATLGGTVETFVGANVTERGAYWSTTNGFTPPEQGTKVTETGNWNSTGAFTVNVNMLPASTPIYFQAFAANSAGTGYSTQGTFTTTTPTAPTVTSPSSANVTITTATLGGTVTDPGGVNVTERGVYWSTTNGFTPPAGTKVLETGDWGAPGAFTVVVNVSGLSPGTPVYFQAFATNSVGTSYSAQATFTTLAAPTVASPTSADVTKTTATLGGTVSATGGANVTERGVYWSTTNGFTPPEQGTKMSEIGDWGDPGAFTVVINVGGLSPGTPVYFRAFATNYVGTSYSEQAAFTTLTAPTIASPTSADVTQTTATLGGTVSATGGANVTERGVYWSTTNGFTPPAGTQVSETGDWSETGAFTVSVSGLSPNTPIYFRAFATNSAGTSYSVQTTFTTLAENSYLLWTK